jgi:DDE family transposase
VVAHLVGHELAVPVDLEPIRPGEGEIVAARRLAERVFEQYGRVFQVVVGDALYLEAPFFNFCWQHKKHVVAVLKGDQRLLLQDAQGLFSQRPPEVWHEERTTIQVWDEEGFTSCESIQPPLRVLHTVETEVKRQRVAGQWREKMETHNWWWATTLPRAQLSTHPLWRAAHSRWDIENDDFNTLGMHWALNHCFKHDPQAILNFVLTLFVVFVLLQSFYRGNLKPARRARLTLIALGDQLYAGWAAAGYRLRSAGRSQPPDTS